MRKFKTKGSIPSLDTLTYNGLLIPAIDMYLMRSTGTEDRTHGWNSPSGIGGCERASYFTRLSMPRDKNSANSSPRSIRILNNGTLVHERLQNYLKSSGVLLLDEATVFNEEYKVMGSTDGLLLDNGSISILEIKSINSNGFNSLRDAKDEHKMQASLYMYCIDEMRKAVIMGKENELREKYLNKLKSFLKDGHKFTRQEKIEMKLKVFNETLEILRKYPKAVNKIIFLYECKDTQELKEIPFERNNTLLKEVLEKCKRINNAVLNKSIPPIEKSFYCNWCNFKEECKKC